MVLLLRSPDGPLLLPRWGGNSLGLSGSFKGRRPQDEAHARGWGRPRGSLRSNVEKLVSAP